MDDEQIFTGAALVVVTWALVTSAFILAGLLIASSLASRRGTALRYSLWWGLAIITVTILLVSLFVPLGSGQAGVSVMLVTVFLGLPGIWRFRRIGKSSSNRSTSGIQLLSVAILIGALSVAIAYLAVAALGPATNYDTGLYHYGAYLYQSLYGLVPGIANLYFPLGYGNSAISLSAFLSSTPWGDEGFRLFNGSLLALAALDLVFRMRQAKWTPGTYLLVSALVFMWIPMVALSDYWVTSPTSDTSILVLTTVSVAYFADGLVSRKGLQQTGNFTVAIVSSLVMCTMRPTMALFSLALIVIVVLISRRKRTSLKHGKYLIASIAFAVPLIVVGATRDRILSGWWQYPLSVFAFDVPWRAIDPSAYRTATLGAARDPENLWEAAENWSWIPKWLSASVTQWEFILAIVLVAGSVALVVVASVSHAVWRPRLLAVAMTPSLLSVVAWFLASPPYFRFVWGPLFTACSLPGAFAATALSRMSSGSVFRVRTVAIFAGLSLTSIVVFSSVTRLDIPAIREDRVFELGQIHIPYAVAGIPDAPTSSRVLISGLEVDVPIESDQCWASFPLCTPIVEESVTPQGDSISEGFLP